MDEFDVELWERRLRLRVAEPIDRSRPDLVEFEIAEPDFDLDPVQEGSAEVGVPAFPVFEHGQWTMEGEIERFGAFGRGASRAVGWKRVVAIALVILLVAPILVAGVVNLAQLLT
jgi:hypothetical protein